MFIPSLFEATTGDAVVCLKGLFCDDISPVTYFLYKAVSIEWALILFAAIAGDVFCGSWVQEFPVMRFHYRPDIFYSGVCNLDCTAIEITA